jgi:hypothetical protein
VDDLLLAERLRAAADAAAAGAAPAGPLAARRRGYHKLALRAGGALLAAVAVAAVLVSVPQFQVVQVTPAGRPVVRTLGLGDFIDYREYHPTSPIYVVDEGSRDGVKWRVVAFRGEHGEVCTGLDTEAPPVGDTQEGGGGAGCGPAGPDGAMDGDIQSGAGRDFDLLVATVPRTVARYRVQLLGGKQVEGTVVPVPGQAFAVAVVQVPKKRDSQRALITRTVRLDADGHVLCDAAWPGNPGEPLCP